MEFPSLSIFKLPLFISSMIPSNLEDKNANSLMCCSNISNSDNSTFSLIILVSVLSLISTVTRGELISIYLISIFLLIS